MLKAGHLVFLFVAQLWACGGARETGPVETTALPADTESAATDAPPVERYQEEWIHLPLRVFFGTGGATLDSEDEALLREAAAALSGRPDIVRIRVEGQTNDDEGSREEQDRLSRARAEAVAEFMIGELGLERELFQTIGFGSDRPLLGYSPPHPIDYRRVEFSLLLRRPVRPPTSAPRSLAHERVVEILLASDAPLSARTESACADVAADAGWSTVADLVRAVRADADQQESTCQAVVAGGWRCEVRFQNVHGGEDAEFLCLLELAITATEQLAPDSLRCNFAG